MSSLLGKYSYKGSVFNSKNMGSDRLACPTGPDFTIQINLILIGTSMTKG